MRNTASLLLITFCVLCSSAAADSNNTDLSSVVSNAPPGILQLQNTTYEAYTPVHVPGGVIIIGSGDTTIIGNFENFKTKGASMIIFDGVSDAGICNVKIDGGVHEGQYGKSGHDFENAISIGGGSKNISIANVNFTGLTGDGVRGMTSGSSDVLITDCRFDKVGHDGVQDWDGDKWTVQRCYFNLFINSGVRIANANDCLIADNYFTSNTGSGFAGVELENDVNGTEIIRNAFSDIKSSRGIGIVTVHATGSVNIYDNKFSGCCGGDIVASGITITNNYIETNEDSEGLSVLPGIEDCEDDCSEDINSNSTLFGFLNDSIFNQIFDIALNETRSNQVLYNHVMDSSADTLLQARDVPTDGTNESKEYVKQLINDSEVKDDMGLKLYNMTVTQHDKAREMLKKQHGL